jgi:hypothetical protein
MLTNLVAHRETMVLADSMRKTRTIDTHRSVNPCHACALFRALWPERALRSQPFPDQCHSDQKKGDPGSLRTVEYIEKIKACYTRCSTTSVLCSVVAPQSSSGNRIKM